PTGATALTQSFTAQSFTTNQSQTYTASLTPSLLGTYTVDVEVLSATGQQWSMNSSAGAITVNSSLSWTSSATANPTSIAASGSSTVTFTVKDTGSSGLTNANVEVEVFNSSGTACGYQVYSGQNFTAGGTLSYTYTWTPSAQSPAVTATGSYTVEIGVFDSAWTTDYYWNSNAATITVTAGTQAPIAPTGLTATAGNASVKLSWTASAGAT